MIKFIKHTLQERINFTKLVNQFYTVFNEPKKKYIKVKLCEDHLKMLYTLMVYGITSNEKLEEYIDNNFKFHRIEVKGKIKL